MASLGHSLVVQWLGLCASTSGTLGLIPALGTKTPQATQVGQKKKKKVTGLTIIRFYFLTFIEIQLIYNVVLLSGVQQSDSVIQIIHVCFSLDSFPL